MNKLITYFLRGLLFITPIAVTIYLLFTMLTAVDSVNPWKDRFPGVGLLIVLASVTFIGFIGSRLIFKPFFQLVEKLITRIPFINLVYTSIKDLVSAFVGDKKKFNKPVLVLFNKENNIRKIGFITQEDLSHWDINNSVAVYFPQAYAFAGDLYIIDSANITVLDASVSDVMKFIVSGGVTKI